MKEKIELNQADMLKLLVEKLDFLTKEYNTLFNCYKHEKGKINVDPIMITESYQRFLKEQGDIQRLLFLYNNFLSDEQKSNHKG